MIIGVTGLKRLIQYKNAVLNDNYDKKAEKSISKNNWSFFAKWCRRRSYVRDVVIPEIKFRQKNEEKLKFYFND